MRYQTSVQDRQLADELDTLRWPPADFNHRLHIRLAYIYLCQHGQDEALRSMRDWTLRYLSHHGIDPAGKYNETLTRAWMLAVRHFMACTTRSVSSEHFIAQNPRLLDSKIMMSHYTPERLWSVEARESFLEPDRAPIPRHLDPAA